MSHIEPTYGISAKKLQAYSNYKQTYVERDVRQLVILKDQAMFEKFIPTRPSKTSGQLENNWVPTDPDKGVLVVFRFNDPLERYIEKTRILNDFERVE